MPQKCFSPHIRVVPQLCFHIPDHVCTPPLCRHARTHTPHTHSLFQGIMRHYVYVQQSSLPAVWGLPGSVYLHNTVVSLRVVDDLWYLPVFYWCTIVISRWTKKEKCCLGPRCRFLGHFLQPFCAVMGVWALSFKNRHWVSYNILCSFIQFGSFLNTASSDWPLRWHMQCSRHWVGFPQAL